MESNNQSSFIKRYFKLDIPALAIASIVLAMSLTNAVHRFYYVKIFLERFSVTEKWTNIGQTFYIVANTVNGPLIAYLVDYRFSAISRRRTVLIAGPLFVLAFWITWFPWTTDPKSKDWLVGLHLMTMLYAWNFTFTLLMCAFCGLFAELSTDSERRVRMVGYNTLASMVGYAVVAPIDKISHSTRDFRSFQFCCIGVGCISLVFFIFAGLKASDLVAQTGTKRKIRVPENPESNAEPVTCVNSLKTALNTVWQVMHIQNFWCSVGSNFMTWARTIIEDNFFAIFTEALISESVLPTGSYAIATFYFVSQIAPKIIFVLANPFVAKFGSYRIFMGSLVATWLNGALGLFLGIGYGYNAMMYFLIMESILVVFQDLFIIVNSEVVDLDTEIHNRKMPATTVIFVMTGLLIQPSAAIAPMLVVGLLNLGGYDEFKSSIRTAPPYTKQIIFILANVLPAVLALLAFLIMLPYKRKTAASDGRAKVGDVNATDIGGTEGNQEGCLRT